MKSLLVGCLFILVSCGIVASIIVSALLVMSAHYVLAVPVGIPALFFTLAVAFVIGEELIG